MGVFEAIENNARNLLDSFVIVSHNFISLLKLNQSTPSSLAILSFSFGEVGIKACFNNTIYI